MASSDESLSELLAQIWDKAVILGLRYRQPKEQGVLWELQLPGGWRIWVNSTDKPNYLPSRPEVVPPAAIFAQYKAEPGYILPLRSVAVRVNCTRAWLDALNNALSRAKVLAR